MKTIYSFWGKRPFLYSLSCVITFLGREEELRRKAVKNLRLKKGDTVIDIACGTGLNFPYLHSAVGSKRAVNKELSSEEIVSERVVSEGMIIGVDYSKEMLLSARDYAAQKGIGNINLVNCDASKISAEILSLDKLSLDKTFLDKLSLDKLSLNHKADGVLSTLGISAIPDYEETLKRAYGLLKKGGRMTILDAKPFNGVLSVFNPVIKPMYKHFANWDYNKDIIGTLEKLAGKVDVVEYNMGTIYIATVVKS